MTYMRNISIIVPSSACLTPRGPTILGNYLPLWSKNSKTGGMRRILTETLAKACQTRMQKPRERVPTSKI